jgi:glycosyltransferase involved in cell wall biosynthesis
VKKSVKISVIIPVYNGAKFIKKCLDRLIEQNFKESFEIIIVDDASTDNSIKLIKKDINYLILNYFILPKNSGQSAARNYWNKKNLLGNIFFFKI